MVKSGQSNQQPLPTIQSPTTVKMFLLKIELKSKAMKKIFFCGYGTAGRTVSSDTGPGSNPIVLLDI